MKVKDYKKWKAIKFLDRTILKSDLNIMSSIQKENIENVQIDYENHGTLFVEGTL